MADYTANGTKVLSGNEAKTFLTWIRAGEITDAGFAARNSEAFAKVATWRSGFLQSIKVAGELKGINPALSKYELKALAQTAVNGKASVAGEKYLTGRAVDAFNMLGKASAEERAAYWVTGLKAAGLVEKVGTGLFAFGIALGAVRGAMGQGHDPNMRGVLGAGLEAERELMAADLVEGIVFPKIVNTANAVGDYFHIGEEPIQLKKYRQMMGEPARGARRP